MDARKIPTQYFDPKKVGEDLSEVALELISVEDQQVESRWFHSQYDADLFVWTDAKGFIIKQQMSFMGQIVEWNFVDGVKTGFVIEDEIGGADMKASEVVRFDSKSQQATVDMAMQILEYFKASSEFKHKLSENFSGKALNRNLGQKKKASKLTKALDRFKDLFKK